MGRREMRESTFTNAICKAESKQINKDFAYCEDALGRAENAIGNLPSAQPKERTEKRTETHACDLIDRQAAIDVVKRIMGDRELSRTVQTGLHILPSAQPERKMGMHNVRPGDRDYPLHMLLVEDREKYDLISVDGEVFIPLFQVVDKLMCVTPDVIIRNGKRICPNCGAETKGEDDE